MQNRDKLYIDGEWRMPAGSKTIDVVSPSTEEAIGRVPEGTPEDVDAAVRSGAAAFEGWAATPVSERAALLSRIHEGLKARADEIGRTIAGEVGMPLKLATRIQAGSPIFTFSMYAKMLADFRFEEKVGNSIVLREPAGVVDAAGAPGGAFNLVTGYGPVAGEALAKHPRVDMVSFTGSVRAGKRVAELASQTMKRVTLELGGKSASVILDDADLAAAVKGTIGACFLNTGQTCSAHTRMLVPESRYEEAARLAVEAAKGFTVGDPFGDSARLGPLTSAAQRERVRNYIKKGIEEGADLLTGGPEAPEGLARGYYVKPTVFGRVNPKSTIAQEEIFGPVLSIITYRNEDEAVRIANDTLYGLAGGVWSKDEERAKRVARRLRTGQVDINGGPFNMLAPFGGVKHSGKGRELGRAGLEEYLEYKSLQLKAEARA